MDSILRNIAAHKTALIVILTPILASPLIKQGSDEARCAFCVVLMAVYWMCEVMPLAVTALLPVVLFPILAILPSKVICITYLPDTNFLFIGGLIVAVAVEKCNLHQRIALRVLTIVGSQPKWIMAGFMAVTAFLSMWISNTATTAMMVPIAQSVIVELVRMKYIRRESIRRESLREPPEPPEPGDEIALGLVRHEVDNNGHFTARDEDGDTNDTAVKHVMMKTAAVPTDDSGGINMDKLSRADSQIAKGLMISICFAANIGGTGTITGTPPNLVFVGQLDKLYKKAPTGINYLSWMVFAVPPMIVMAVGCWFCLLLYFFGLRAVCPRRGDRSAENTDVSNMMCAKYRNLPPMSYAEKSVLCCFSILLCLWIFRNPRVIPGWGALFEESYVTDATSSIAISILLFLLPNDRPTFSKRSTDDDENEPKKGGNLMDWKSMQAHFPWSVVLLLGGGFALASGVKESGLSDMVGDLLGGLGGMPLIALQLLCVFVTMGITNICSNTVTASIFVPIVAGLAENLQVHPLVFMLPVTLACSTAFTLPVATPPNAIVFASGVLHVTDMMKAGLLVTLMCAVVIVATMNLYAPLFMNLDNFPAWANRTTADALDLTAPLIPNATIFF